MDIALQTSKIIKKYTKMTKHIGYMVQNSRGVFFLRSAKRRRHADWAHQAKNTQQMSKYIGHMLQNSRGVFFLRSAKRRRHADWAHQAKSNKNDKIHK